MAWWLWLIIGLLLLFGLPKLILVINLIPQVPFYQSKEHFRIMKKLYRSGHARFYLEGVPEKNIRKYEALVLKSLTYFQYRREMMSFINKMRNAGDDIRPMATITTIWKNSYFDD